MPSIDFALTSGYTVVDPLPKDIAKKYKFLKITERGSTVYDRKDQVVAREIIIFQYGKLQEELTISNDQLSNNDQVLIGNLELEN